jgi:hypothetical protein
LEKFSMFGVEETKSKSKLINKHGK